MSSAADAHADALVARARAVFPGEKWTRGPFTEDWFTQDAAFPKILARGEGCKVWDERGKEYVDYLGGFGANILGYGDKRVEAAANAAAEAVGGHTLTGPTRYSVELAERLVSLRPGATWAFFGKNGTDVTTAARMVARIKTGKRGVLREAVVASSAASGVTKGASSASSHAYHGASPQWMRGKPGVLPEESSAYEASFTYNDLASVERAVASLDGDVAAIFVGSLSYPWSSEIQFPTREFVQGLRAIANKAGALLVLDEIRTNCRLGRGLAPGIWNEIGGDEACAPDMFCQCKALANGHPISALIGADSARAAAAKLAASGTYWLAAPPMAAALTCLDILQADNHAVLRHIENVGTQFSTGLARLCQEKGLPATVSGPPCMPCLTFDDELPLVRPKSVHFASEMALLGYWLHPHHNWYIGASHSMQIIRDTLAAASTALDKVAAAHGKQTRASL